MNLNQEPRRYSSFRLFLYRCLVFLFSRVLPGKKLYAPLLKGGAFDLVVQFHGSKDLDCSQDMDTCFKIIHLSDFHAGPYLDSSSLSHVVQRVNEQEPHVIVFTGDFITRGPEDLDLIMDALSRLRFRCGAYAVFGNHDYRYRREHYMEERLQEAGIRTLRNRWARATWQDRDYWFLGIEDIEEGKYPDLASALEGLKEKRPRILLSHNPDVINHLEPGVVDLILSGHTHGGQIRLPWIKPMGAGYKGNFMRGLYLRKNTRLYVNSGLGCLVLPFRIRARPEVTLHLLP